MLAIEVEYLLGRAVATDTTRRDRVEWPPHPTRLFSALVDALSDVSEPDACARAEAALRWLEREPAPNVCVSMGNDVSMRTVAKYFVAVNDEVANPKKMRPAPLPELRPRQERFFPAAVPADPCVVFAWSNSEPTVEHSAALSELAARVPYLGHSSSVVRVFCRDTAPPSTITPSETGEWRLRVPGPGRLDRLNAVYEARKTNTFVQPPLGREVPYGPTNASRGARGPHGQMRVLAFDDTSARFGLTETAWLTSRLRAALLSRLPNGTATPETLSGHGKDGKPAKTPHIAFVPLANVANSAEKYADGSVKGLGVLLPRTLDAVSAQLLESALARIERLVFGDRGEIHLRQLRLETGATRGRQILYSLDASRYTRASTTWATVTPIALGLHPKPAKGLTAEGVVVRHLTELGLPVPASLCVHPVSQLWGAPHAHAFHRGNVKALAGRMLVHAVIEFSELVEGPLVVGAARHMGFGLLHPCGGQA